MYQIHPSCNLGPSSDSFNKGGEFQPSTSGQYRGNETLWVLQWAWWLWTSCSLISTQSLCFVLTTSQHSKTARSQLWKACKTCKHMKVHCVPYQNEYLQDKLPYFYLWNTFIRIQEEMVTVHYFLTNETQQKKSSILLGITNLILLSALRHLNPCCQNSNFI